MKKEQSHKEEMSAAIRGDFQRLRERGVSTELAPGEPPASHTDSRPDGPPGHGSEGQASVAESSAGEPVLPAQEAVAPSEEERATPSAAEPLAEAGSAPAAGWLGRLLGHS